MEPITADGMIEMLVDSLTHSASERQTHLLRESLRALVRLAKIEQRVEIKRDVAKATRLARLSESRRAAKRLLDTLSAKDHVSQQRLRFD